MNYSYNMGEDCVKMSTGAVYGFETNHKEFVLHNSKNDKLMAFC